MTGCGSREGEAVGGAFPKSIYSIILDSMDIYGVFILKGIISLSLHEIRCQNNNFVYKTLPFHNQKGGLPVSKKSTCRDKT